MVLLPFLGLSALAQYTIKNIVIHGAAPYTEEEILNVSGLQPGQMMTQNSLGNAAQHLLDTGVFADAQMDLSGELHTPTVDIDLKPLPASSLAPASFANFVWWTPAELDSELRQRVPLYRGGIPPAGNLPDSVAAAFTAMLTSKGIQGAVSNTPVQPTNAHPQLTWQFRLDDPTLSLASVELTGAPPALAPALQRAVAHATGSFYNEGLSGETIDDQLLAPLRNAGYLEAKLTNIDRTASPAAKGYAVHYSATIVPGELFHVNSVTCSPTPIYSQDAFTHDAKLHPNDLASQQDLLTTEDSIVNVYLHRGYLDAYVDPHPRLDSSAHTVTYALEIIPGEIYHLKTVTPLNLSPAAQQDFDRGWLLKPGAVYDPLYVSAFLTNNTALRSLGPYRGSFQASADPQTHLVDLTINFVYVGIRYQ
jgi:outer membrane protein assembly factor BamA